MRGARRTCIDLCAGAGGLTRGLKDAGISVEIAVESAPHAATTYRANFPTVDLLQEDVRDLSAKTLRRKLKERNTELFLLVAGLPCQGFSESNRRTRTARNPKNLLYKDFLRYVKALEPRWFLIENVAGIATLQSGAFLDRIRHEFSEAGYRVDCRILSAGDFQVPQLRRRAFIVGHRLEADLAVFPSPQEEKNALSVREAIADLPALENGAGVDVLPYASPRSEVSSYAQALRVGAGRTVTGNLVSRNSQRVLERYRHIPPGSNFSAIPQELMKNYKDLSACHTGIYYRLKWDAPAKVIGNFRKNMLIHPGEDRGLSVREAARLQSFPDDHVFLGPLNDRQQQVGDAVPPRLAKAVGAAIIEADGRAS